MNATDLARVIETVGRDRGIKRELLITAIEQAMLSAATKKYGPNAILEAHYNEESGEVDLFLFKKVVDSDDAMLEESEEIKIEDAHELDPEAQIGDELGIKVETPSFGRIDAQFAKQVIFTKVREAERDIVFNEFISQKGEIVSGIARRIERGSLVIDLGKTDALLPRSQIIPGETFRPGDRVQALLEDVTVSTRGPQLYLSRTSPKYLMKLFENEVPEIRDEVIEIKGCARDAGVRAKISVISKDRDIDPVGACVGMKGVRVQQVIQELRGEKIDIIPWSENPVVFVKSSLSPAEISSIRVDERNKTMEIMVEDNQLSIAIGRKGQNVRLAAQLSGWRLDIVSRSKLTKKTQDVVLHLQNIEGVNETLATSILQAGFSGLRQVAEAPVEALMKIPAYEARETATQLKARAAAAFEKVGDTITPTGDDKGTFTADANSGHKTAKAMAEDRLREMMKQSTDGSERGNE